MTHGSPAPPIRVLVDASALPAQRGGVGRYVDEVVRGLARLDDEVLVVAQERDAELYRSMVGPTRTLVVPRWAAHPALRLVWEQIGLPFLVRRHRPDVLHSPHYTLPLAVVGRRAPARVVTMHDATFFSHPEVHGPVKSRFFRAWIRVSSRLADAVVVPSRATAGEVVAHAGADAGRIRVVPHGVDLERFRPASAAEVEAAREWLGTGDTPYLLFLGTIEPRKNVPALVDAYVLACEGRPDPPVLVLAGARGWEDRLEHAVARVPEPLRVLRPGFVPDDLLPGLLGGALVMTYPSLGEGFGLPVLEAMACGAVVLTTRELSLPEVGGDSAAYAPGTSAEALAGTLAQLLDDVDMRGRLAASGRVRALKFSWGRAASLHQEAFKGAVLGRTSRARAEARGL
ncbi:glycosyltransferase family 1 protein [Phycicoccus ginsengisoli]